MLQLTIQEVLDGSICTNREECIYIYRDEEGTYLYIGCSIDPYERLLQHLGNLEQALAYPSAYPDAIGTFILDHKPASLHWPVEIWTLQDLFPILYQDGIKPQDMSFLVRRVESYLIYELSPCLNAWGKKQKRTMPLRYAASGRIANAGVKLD